MIRWALALIATSCTSGSAATTDHVAAGIYVVDRMGGDPVRLVPVDGDMSAIKFGVLGRADGTVDVAYVKDDDRNLYTSESTFVNGSVSSTPPVQRLVRSDEWSLNGPTYCQARNELAISIWQTSALDVDMIDADTLRSMAPSSVEQAIAKGALSPLQTAASQISTDLTCGNLPNGAVYNFVDCAGSTNVEACLSAPYISRIDFKPALADPAERLTFPELDPDVEASLQPALVGDNGPAVFVADDASMHVMFERDYTNAITAADPEFEPFGFNKLMYKHIVGDPASTTEYELDFSRWLPQPAPLEIVNSSSVRLVSTSTVDFLALGVFDTPDPSAPYDDIVYMGIVAGQFDDSALPLDSSTLVLDPARVTGVLTFDRFTCYAWTTYGISEDGSEVDMYAIAYPQFMPDGTDRIAFSATKYHLATLADGVVTYPNGSAEPEDQLDQRVCARP